MSHHRLDSRILLCCHQIISFPYIAVSPKCIFVVSFTSLSACMHVYLRIYERKSNGRVGLCELFTRTVFRADDKEAEGVSASDMRKYVKVSL